MRIEELQANYRSIEPLARTFLAEFTHQFSALLSKAEIKLGVPLESRVKDWHSLAAKIDKKSLKLDTCINLTDLIGVRAITLFKRDVASLVRLIEKTFPVQEKEDKADNLEQNRFGYLSQHFIVKLPRAWKKIPGFPGPDFIVEIQVRTLSQHIWAAASHHLQYKKEADVPPVVTRSIHRVAALLETVDLEFERVLEERARYMKSPRATDATSNLDTDNIKLLLDQSFPAENRDEDEAYSELLSDLRAFNITTVEALSKLIETYKNAALKAEAEAIEDVQSQTKPIGTTTERTRRGVFFTHIGLARQLLVEKFGKKWNDFNKEKYAGSTILENESFGEEE